MSVAGGTSTHASSSGVSGNNERQKNNYNDEKNEIKEENSYLEQSRSFINERETIQEHPSGAHGLRETVRELNQR